MPAEVWALLSAIFFGVSHIASKRGLQDTSVVAGSLLILGASWPVIAFATLVDPPQGIPGRTIAIFAVLGLFVPALSRLATLKTVDALGPSIGIPIQNGLRPLLSVTGAVLLLGETLGPVRILGIAAIVAGGWVLSRRPRAPAPDPGIEAPLGARPERLSWREALRPGIVYPLLAALAYATVDVVARETLEDVPEGSFAALVSTTVGLAVWLFAIALVPRVRAQVRFGRRGWWLVLAGAFVGAAVLSTYNALQRGDVSLVSPITSTQPLMVFVLSALFLRGIERVTLKIVLSGVAIVAGTILVSA